MEERVKKFKSIFYGLDRAYGQYKSDGQLVNGKASGQAFIKKAPVTDQLWIDHIEGKDPSLGIVPIMDDSNCRWGCIDIDVYNVDHLVLMRSIKGLGFPLVTFRSKSGGAHLFLFSKYTLLTIFSALDLLKPRTDKASKASFLMSTFSPDKSKSFLSNNSTLSFNSIINLCAVLRPIPLIDFILTTSSDQTAS